MFDVFRYGEPISRPDAPFRLKTIFLSQYAVKNISGRILRARPIWAYKDGVQKSIHSPEYQKVLGKLIALRQKAGMTQRDLAKKLGREHSFVWRIENGERRLDVVEFFWVCQALGQDATKIYRELVAAFQSDTGKGG